MKKYSIVCICQVYNELEKGNLERFIRHISPICDTLIVYDDCSTDGTYEYLLKYTPFVIRSNKNSFKNEMLHKEILLEKAKQLEADFVLWLDADEVLASNAANTLQQLCLYCDVENIDGISMHKLNIWRSNIWRRVDSLYDDGWAVQLWKINKNTSYKNIGIGLHQQPYPTTMRNIQKTRLISVLHYGFANEKNLAYKYLIYKSHGQRGYNMLDRLISEEKLLLEKIPADLFPEGLYVEEDAPIKMTFSQSLEYVEKYEKEVFRPRYSIICLIYKSVKWLKFVYEQVYKYTDLTDKEFYFIANDASPEVINYLKNNYIPYYEYHNTEEQKKEWYINNVYRAYNYGAQQAKGDYLIFINSDMAFSENWFENLVGAYDGHNCLASRLIESGKLKTGQYGMEKNFGVTVETYDEEKFTQYVKKVSWEDSVCDGGLFMPLYIKKEHFSSVGGYPEGNIKEGTNIFSPIIAKKGESLISGDNVLMMKLRTKGVRHQTVFDSIVYHFQCGELDDKNVDLYQSEPRIALCNDLVTGSMGEKVLWDFMLENIPSIIGIDKRIVGYEGCFEENARNYIKKNYPSVCMIIQNATFIDRIDKSLYTISFLQDDLRSMDRRSIQQENNLESSNKLVTNSVQTSEAYNEYEFDIISIGINSELFKPMYKEDVRKEFGFSTQQTIGIFVGSFSEVKGWSKVTDCFEKYPEIQFIAVTKYEEEFDALNVSVFKRISQEILAKLYNCADFFILGSPVETQCLAALEACLCNIPVIMKNVGIFKDFSSSDKNQIGIFGDDFHQAIKDIKHKQFYPRQLVLSKGVSIDKTIELWTKQIKNNMKSAMLYKYNLDLKTERERERKLEIQAVKEKNEKRIFYRKQVFIMAKQKFPQIYSVMRRLYHKFI